MRFSIWRLMSFLPTHTHTHTCTHTYAYTYTSVLANKCVQMCTELCTHTHTHTHTHAHTRYKHMHTTHVVHICTHVNRTTNKLICQHRGDNLQGKKKVINTDQLPCSYSGEVPPALSRSAKKKERKTKQKANKDKTNHKQVQEG